MSRNWIIAVAAVGFVTGVALSHRIWRGVRVEKVMRAGILPATPAPHPKVLLAHGMTGSKENLFCFGEAVGRGGRDD